MSRGKGGKQEQRQVRGKAAAEGGALAFCVALALSCGCRVAPPQATALDAQRAHVELAELQHGRALLLTKCGGSCHAAPLPSAEPRDAWPSKLDEMSARAGLDLEQHRLIQQYLVTMAPPDRR